jgi:hypothetical protein
MECWKNDVGYEVVVTKEKPEEEHQSLKKMKKNISNRPNEKQ